MILLVVCCAVAALLVTNAITPIVGGVVFAIALATTGIFSKGFRMTKGASSRKE
jgi:hypothetical protein